MKKLFEDAELELIRFGMYDIIVTSGGALEDTETDYPDVDDEDDGDASAQSDDGNVNDSFDIADIG